FGAMGRDFESLGLARVSIRQPGRKTAVRDTRAEVVDATVRILAGRQRFPGVRLGTVNAPGYLKRYWKAVAGRTGEPAAEIESDTVDALSGSMTEFILNPDRLIALGPG